MIMPVKGSVNVVFNQEVTCWCNLILQKQHYIYIYKTSILKISIKISKDLGMSEKA